MSIYLLCLTTNSGLPIFTRKKGDCDNLPFSTVASLNGFHMFFKSLGVVLETTKTRDWTYLWHDYHEVITLIVCARGMSENQLETMLELVFGALTLFISCDELAHPNLLERIKKEAKNYMPIVDAAMELSSPPQLLGFTSTVLTCENSHLLQRLNDFSEQCGSLFCCIIVGNHIAVATEGWWDLHYIDRKLLNLLMTSSSSIQFELPLYLPRKSPNVAYRFVSIPFRANSALCVICGITPSYQILHTTAQNIFRNEFSLLHSIEARIPDSIPNHLEFDRDILALILANTNCYKSVYLNNGPPISNTKSIAGDCQYSEMLNKFFYHTLETCNEFADDKHGTSIREIVDLHWCTDNHKYYALKDEYGNVIFLLFVPSIPTHLMKFRAKKILSSLINDKLICW